jgi:hypothetical protein
LAATASTDNTPTTTTTTVTTPATAEELAKWIKKDKKAFGIIDGSLSQLVHHNLPSHLSTWHALVQRDSAHTDEYRATLPSASERSLKHLQETYSAARGSRRAELLAIIWRSQLVEGEDPTVHTGKLKSAYSAITVSG